MPIAGQSFRSVFLRRAALTAGCAPVIVCGPAPLAAFAVTATRRPESPIIREAMLPGISRAHVHELRDPAVYREGTDAWLLFSIAGEHGLGLAKLRYDDPALTKSKGRG
jgi:hypothetical protein